MQGNTVYVVIDDKGNLQGVYADVYDADEAALACGGKLYQMEIR